MPRSNKPICTKNPSNPINFANLEIKWANLKTLETKHQKNPTKLAYKKKKKKKPKPKFCSQKHEKKKPKPHRLWICNGWGVVHGGFLMGEVLDSLIVVGLVGKHYLVFWAWFWLWWLGWVASFVVLDRLRERLREGSDNLGRWWDWEWVRVGEEIGSWWVQSVYCEMREDQF